MCIKTHTEDLKVNQILTNEKNETPFHVIGNNTMFFSNLILVQ